MSDILSFVTKYDRDLNSLRGDALADVEEKGVSFEQFQSKPSKYLLLGNHSKRDTSMSLADLTTTTNPRLPCLTSIEGPSNAAWSIQAKSKLIPTCTNSPVPTSITWPVGPMAPRWRNNTTRRSNG